MKSQKKWQYKKEGSRSVVKKGNYIEEESYGGNTNAATKANKWL